MTVTINSILGSWKRALLASAFVLLAPFALANDPVSEIRVVTDLGDIVVGEVVGVEFEFYDDQGQRIALAPEQTITVAPAGVFPCDLPACTNADYSEQIATQAGRETYLVYLRSLVAGVNYLTLIHPNGTRLQHLLNAVDGAAEPPAPPPTAEPPTRFSILSQPSELTPGAVVKFALPSSRTLVILRHYPSRLVFSSVRVADFIRRYLPTAGVIKTIR